MNNLIDILNCNLNNCNFKNIDVEDDMNKYNNSLSTFENYVPQESLESWFDSKHVYPNIDPRHRFIVDVIKKHNYKKIIDLGAGAGCVSKSVFMEHKDNIDELICVEHNKTHFDQMNDNFQNNYDIVPPIVKVNAETINRDILSVLKSYPDNYFDVGFTCTVIMHIPYVLSIIIIKEMSRVCKNVIHAENQNDTINCIVAGKTQLKEQYCCINYETLYKKLGFTFETNNRVKDPYASCYYVYLHANKII